MGEEGELTLFNGLRGTIAFFRNFCPRRVDRRVDGAWEAVTSFSPCAMVEDGLPPGGEATGSLVIRDVPGFQPGFQPGEIYREFTQIRLRDEPEHPPVIICSNAFRVEEAEG